MFKGKLRSIGVTCFTALMGFGIYLYVFSKQQYPSFQEWYQENIRPTGKKLLSTPERFFISSGKMKVDRIFRSMQGPYDLKYFYLNLDDQLLWLKGYKSNITDENKQPVSDAFMCHNNLNLKNREDSPWKIPTLGSDTRLFTLTEGQTEVILPDGFGIPVTPSQELELVSQVLNHNYPTINKLLKHNIEILYYPEKSVGKITPLYQQSIFVTKQTSGPKGNYGEPPEREDICEVHTDSSSSKTTKNSLCCAPDISTEDYNPFLDQYGREYTGHWKIEPNYEELSTNVTPMLNLTKDTKVHYIGIHVHPFAESLELRDITADSTVYKAYVENHEDRVGIKKIDHFSSKKGIWLYKDHQYELISIYKNTTGEKHTAMATMFLYLAEPN